MKQVLLGTLSCLVIVVAALALASHWPVLFWLLALSLSIYLLFGRKLEVEFRVGVGAGKERRLYGALTWKHRASETKTEIAEAREPGPIKVSAVGRNA